MTHARPLRLLGDRVRVQARSRPSEEKAELAKIAARSTEPQLAYAHRRGDRRLGVDPDVNQRRPGQRSARVRAAPHRARRASCGTAGRRASCQHGESRVALRRNVVARPHRGARARRMSRRKYVGGVSTLRDHAGSRPRAAHAGRRRQRQREALKLIDRRPLHRRQLPLQAGVPAQAVRRLARPRRHRSTSACRRRGFDYSLPTQVLAVQRAVLDRADERRRRAAPARQRGEGRRPGEALQLSELYDTLHAAIWSELKTGRDIPLHAPQPAARARAARWRARCCARRRRCPPTRARCSARTRRRCAREHRAPRRSRAGLLEGGARAPRRERCSTLDEALKAPMRARGADAWQRRRRRRPPQPTPPRTLTLAPLDNRALANLCGPLDANLRQIETALDVDDRAPRRARSRIAGAPRKAAQAARGAARASTRAPREPLSVDDIQLGLVEIARAPRAGGRARQAPRRAAAAHAPRRPARPHAAPGRSTCSDIQRARHHVRHRPRRHRQDLPRRRLRGRRARARRGQAHRAGAPGGRGRRAAGLPARATSRRRSIRTCARCTTRSTT